MNLLTQTPVERDALELRESTHAATPGTIRMPQVLRESYPQETLDKMVPLVIIRPGIGRGRGKHLYEAKMLEENAHVFSKWKMFVDHLSPEARKAAGGLPRSMRDLGGIIMESYWDPTIPADTVKGHDQGGVIGWAIPTPFIRELIDTAPELAEASISANATGVKSVTRGGQRVWLVEGIEDRGSVDWVTEAGAGGRVVALMESAYAEEAEMGLLDSMSDEEFLAHVQETRPHLVEAAAPETPATPPTNNNSDEGDPDTMQITPEALAEAFKTDEFREALTEVVTEVVASTTKTAVEEAVSEERDIIRAEARADSDRRLEIRDLRDEAHGLIEAAKLPEPLEKRLKGRFDLQESGDPTADLDLVDEVDAEGVIVQSAATRLREAVDSAIKEEREVLAAVNPTRVTGQGTADEGEKAPKGENTLYGSVLQEAGVDPATAWD